MTLALISLLLATQHLPAAWPASPGLVLARFESPSARLDAAALAKAGFSAFSIRQVKFGGSGSLALLKAPDLSKVEAWLSSQEAKKAGLAKVEAATDLQDGVFAEMAKNPGLILVRHRVKDVDSWFKGFKAHAGKSHSHGPKRGYEPCCYAVARLVRSPDTLLVMHRADKLEPAWKFMQSKGLRASMRANGVMGDPQVLGAE